MIKICKNPECGISFDATEKLQLYCSKKCSYRAAYIRNQDKKRQYSIKYSLENKEDRKLKRQLRDKLPEIKDANNTKLRSFRNKKKTEILSVLGGTCVFCGDTNIKYLTLDHVNDDGYKERVNGHRIDPYEPYRLVTLLRTGKITLEEIKSKYQVLCWNCNAGVKRREYMVYPKNKNHEYELMYWIAAYHFFGSCKTCGDSDLRHLCVSHIKNDGNMRRKNGEQHGATLFKHFNKLGWPESLKEDYCLECFNCNCSRKEGEEKEKE